MNTSISDEVKAQASQALEHQKNGRYAEAAQIYLAVLARAPQLWQACYNLGLVYQHLNRLPEAVDMYSRAVRLNPNLAEGYNNLGNALKLLKHEAAAIEAYECALKLNANLSEASYNLATMYQARGDLKASIEPLRQALLINPAHQEAWDALYRGLLGQGRQEEAIQAFLAWENATANPTPERVVAGLALCRPMGDRGRETQYLALAIAWPFAEFTPESLSTVLGMLQYFDLTREELLQCYRRYDVAMVARQPAAIALLPRRAADARLRIGYVSADFRQHVMGRMMLDVLARHDRSRFSILLISTCPRAQHDGITAEFRNHADGFADVSELADFAAAKSIAEADIDVLVDLAGHTMAARPGIYPHRPARTIVTHLGYHGCLGLRSVDCKLTDHIADREDAELYQIERPFVLDTCVFPLVRVPASDAEGAPNDDPDLTGKFVFGAFVNVLKLSPRCLAAWRHVLDAVPEAILLFSPFNPAEKAAIERVAVSAGIETSRIVVKVAERLDDAELRARYRLVDAVMDTFPYAGGDTTLAALDMGVPVVTLCGERQSERIGASILGHLGVTDLVADTEHDFVDLCVKLARDAAFMAYVRQRIAESIATNAINSDVHARSLERAYTALAASRPVVGSMTLSARQFFQPLHDAMRRQREATNDEERRGIAAVFVELRTHQPEYPPLLRAQAELAQEMNDLPLASECLAAFLKQSPDDIEARLTLAGFLLDQGAATEALMVMDDALSTVATDIRMLKLRTRAHVLLRQWEAARQTSVVAVELAPTDAQAQFWHGTVLSHVGEPQAALMFLNRALILSPDHAEAAYNAGVLLAELGNFNDAETVFRRALGTAAAQPAHLRLLQVILARGRLDDWRTEALRFINNYRGFERSKFIESRVARHDGDLEREAAILLPLAEQLSMTPDDALATELIAELLPILPFHDVSPRLLQRLHVRYREAAHALFPPVDVAGQMRSRSVGGPQNLGYLADFSLPFSTELIAALASHHDRGRFTLTVYVLSPETSVPWHALQAAGARVATLAAFDERLAAERIRADNLDFLIDASCGGAYAKPGLLSHRPSIVQISLPGLTRATGTGELDARISDAELDVDGGIDAVTVAPWLVRGCAIPIFADAPVMARLTRNDLGLSEEVCIFGVFAAAERISIRCLTLWKSISERVPDAVFLVCPWDARDSLAIRRMMSNSRIAEDRIVTLPPASGPAQGLALSSVVDIILDALPGSDFFSAQTSLHHGIPLVSLSGRLPEERIALSLMTHLGETSTIAASGRDYVDIAAALAFDSAERKRLVTRLQSLWRQSSSEGGALSMWSYTQRIENVLENAKARLVLAQATAKIESQT